jgi:hypothetical protein
MYYNNGNKAIGILILHQKKTIKWRQQNKQDCMLFPTEVVYFLQYQMDKVS